MRELIAYHTVSGDILATRSKDVDSLTVMTTSVAAAESSTLTGSGFSGVVLPGDFCDVVLPDCSRRYVVTDVVSDTELTVESVVPATGSFSCVFHRHEAAAQYSTGEVDAFVDEVKTAVGHTNVAGIRITSNRLITDSTHYVDVNDGNKVKAKSEQIVSE